MDALLTYAWIGWLVLIAIFLAVEMVSGEMTFLMLGCGSVFGLLASLVHLPIWLQVLIAAIAAIVLLLFVRPPLLHRLRKTSDPKLFNVDGLIGMKGTVTETVTDLAGRVKLSNGDSWTARVHDGRALAPQSPVIVESIQGATAFVTIPPLPGAPVQEQ
ncbi:MAG: NfeD family protein [Microbacterium sp.]